MKTKEEILEKLNFCNAKYYKYDIVPLNEIEDDLRLDECIKTLEWVLEE